MTEGAEGKSGWTAGKIFLLILGILAGLGILCCGAGYLLLGDSVKEKLKQGMAFGSNMGVYVARLQKDYGKDVVMKLEPPEEAGKADFVLTIGVSGDLTPARIAEIQDGAWKSLSETFAKDGFFPLKGLGVGSPVAPSMTNGGGLVTGWKNNFVTVEELVKRTGAAAPPLVNFMPKDAFGPHVKVSVNATGDDDKPEDAGGKDGK